ncbi:hypothetical protein FACS1894199_18110 [Bacteroidia bacterium]|nr:hypothetical protein FACS1894199_18110 [Bacteroidia bacterium]
MVENSGKSADARNPSNSKKSDESGWFGGLFDSKPKEFEFAQTYQFHGNTTENQTQTVHIPARFQQTSIGVKPVFGSNRTETYTTTVTRHLTLTAYAKFIFKGSKSKFDSAMNDEFTIGQLEIEFRKVVGTEASVGSYYPIFARNQEDINTKYIQKLNESPVLKRLNVEAKELLFQYTER